MELVSRGSGLRGLSPFGIASRRAWLPRARPPIVSGFQFSRATVSTLNGQRSCESSFMADATGPERGLPRKYRKLEVTRGPVNDGSGSLERQPRPRKGRIRTRQDRRRDRVLCCDQRSFMWLLSAEFLRRARSLEQNSALWRLQGICPGFLGKMFLIRFVGEMTFVPIWACVRVGSGVMRSIESDGWTVLHELAWVRSFQWCSCRWPRWHKRGSRWDVKRECTKIDSSRP